MTTSIFIRSYEKDFPWLDYCLRSVHKFCTGFQEIVVCIPEGADLPLTAERVVKVPDPPGDGYLWQQACKLNADLYTGAENVLYVDSDCVFTEPVTPETFMTEGKPNWLHTPFSVVGADSVKAWFQVMTDCIGHPPDQEFMRRHPQMIPSWALLAFREFIRDKHKMGMEEYVMSRPGRSFSEFNCIGFYLHAHHRERFHWMNTEDYLPPTVLTQKWSHGGLTPAVKEEFEQILA